MDASQVSFHAVISYRWQRDRRILVALLLLAWALRLPPILDNRFHPDEALYAYWGLLIGQGQDPWLATVPVYKPPLLPYLVAGAQAISGPSELAVRLPGLAAGLLTVSLSAGLAYALYRDRWTAGAAAIAVALSPFAIRFSATAFPDSLMVALGVAGSVAAACDRPGWAGMLAGMAFAAKQTGLSWMPLAVLLGSATPTAQVGSSAANRELRAVGRFVVSFVVCVALVCAWDAMRLAQGGQSFWRAGVSGYGGLRLVWPEELWRRLREWIELARCLFWSPVADGMLLVGLPALLWSAIARRRYMREAFADLLLISFCLIYFLVHWLWAFPVWDRYLLPLVPVLAVLLGRIINLVASWLRAVTCGLQSVVHDLPLVVCHLLLVVSLASPAFNAARSRFPAGGDHGAYAGIDQVAAFLRGLPEGSVVYHHWLGWHYRYYLFDAPVYLAYWPTPAWLARDVGAFGPRGPRYMVFPSWESSARVERALGSADYRLELTLTTTRADHRPSFTVYAIVPRSS